MARQGAQAPPDTGPEANARVNATLFAMSQRLRQLRSERGLRLADVAAMSGLSAVHLYRLELAERWPSLPALVTLAEAYGVPPSSLLMPPTLPEDVIAHEARAVWKGAGERGAGVMSLDGVEIPYNVESRLTASSIRRERGGESGGSPEELAVAALTGSYALSLSQQLLVAGFDSTRVEVAGKLVLGTQADQMSILEIHLDVEARVPGIDEPRFQEIAHITKRSSLIARALASVPIRLNARLLPARRRPRAARRG